MIGDVGARSTLPAGIGAPSSRSSWLDRLVGSDPGLNRLRSAGQSVLTIALALGAELLFVHLTNALQITTPLTGLPPAQVAGIAAANHALLVIAMMLGAVVGMIGSFSASMAAGPREQLVTFVLMPVPMVAGLAAGLALGAHRPLALTALVVFLGGGTYCRRFGPRGFIGGMLLFMGGFFGFFLNSAVDVSDVGWLAAEICIGVLVLIVVNFALFPPNQRRALARLRRSYTARSRRVAARAGDLFDHDVDFPRATRRLQRELVRLNETALMIDAQLGAPGLSSSNAAVTSLHQRLFDAELTLTNAARFAEAIAQLEVPPALREQVRQSLVDIREENLERAELSGHLLIERLREHSEAEQGGRRASVLLHRFASSVIAFADALDAWQAACDPTGPSAPGELNELAELPEFVPSVVLMAGWLPGSAMVSAAASTEPGSRPMDRFVLAPYVRVTIQMTVAITGAILLGQVLSERRFYWALIAAFVSFMGTNNVREQVNKSFFRVLGTLVGVMIGALLAHLVGDRTDLAVVVILVAVFFGVYLMRISYAFMVVGITVMVSLLYVQLDEFSDSLLVLRLEETAIGAGVAILTVLFVFPLRTGRVVRVAVRQHVQAVAEVAARAGRVLLDPTTGADLRAAVRTLDATYQALATTVQASRLPFLTIQADHSVTQVVQTAAATRHYARDLAAEAGRAERVSTAARPLLEDALATFAASMSELVEALATQATRRTYVRSASLFDLAATHLEDQNQLAPNQYILRNLRLLDAAMAALAQTARLAVQDLDTTPSDMDVEHR